MWIHTIDLGQRRSDMLVVPTCTHIFKAEVLVASVWSDRLERIGSKQLL